MNLEDFLKLLFNKDIDIYPSIRENILLRLSRHDVGSMYSAFKFLPSVAERTRCMGYSYLDSGIIISYGIANNLRYPVQCTLHDISSLISVINTGIVKWMRRIEILPPRVISRKTYGYLSISSENIEFYSVLSVHISKSNMFSPHTMSLCIKRVRKVDNSTIVANSSTFYYHSRMISRKLNEFAYIISLDIPLERANFQTMLSANI